MCFVNVLIFQIFFFSSFFFIYFLKKKFKYIEFFIINNYCYFDIKFQDVEKRLNIIIN